MLHLYCDDPRHVYWRDGHHPGEFNGRTFGEAVREARRAGWLVSKRAICPLHHPTKKPDPREVAEANARQALADSVQKST